MFFVLDGVQQQSSFSTQLNPNKQQQASLGKTKPCEAAAARLATWRPRSYVRECTRAMGIMWIFSVWGWWLIPSCVGTSLSMG